MKLVKYQAIDPEKWNACIGKIPQAYFYGLYQYLSAICQWEAIIEEDSSGYLFVIPLPFKSKLFLKYLYQPFFCQQLGVFGVHELSKQQEQEVFKIIKKNYVFGSFNWSFKPRPSDYLQIEEAPNYVLDLGLGWDEIQKSFNSNRKRVLKKSNKLDVDIVLLNDDNTIIKTITKFADKLGDRFEEIKPQHYTGLQNGLLAIKDIANVDVYELHLDGNCIAAVLIVNFNDRLVYMLGYVDDKHKKSGINSLLFQNIIEKHAKSQKLLDFEGGKNAGIAQFYSSFGAQPCVYSQIVIRSKVNEILKNVR